MADFCDVVSDVFEGIGSAVWDLVEGLVELVILLGEILAWGTLQVMQADELGFIPEDLDEDVTGFLDGIGVMLTDPESVLEAMGQSLLDTADEKGMAYSISYVAADTLIGWGIGKAIGKLSKAEDVTGATRYIDDIAQYGDEAVKVTTHTDDAIKPVTEAGEHADEVAEVIAEGSSKAIDNVMPNVDNATINPNKLTEYALNPNHPVGGNKAKVFESALGYNQSNVDDLIRQIYEKLPSSEAILGKLDQYGQRYTVDIPIMGPNGNTVTVRTGWIIKTGSDVPELTTIYVID